MNLSPALQFGLGAPLEVLASSERLETWLLDKFERLPEPGAIQLQRRQHWRGRVRGRALDLYAALYPLESFDGWLHFELFRWRQSSIEQDLVRSGTFDPQHFFPDQPWRVTARLVELVNTPTALWTDPTVRQALQEWLLPDDFAWVRELEFQLASGASGADGEFELSARTTAGYVSLFRLNG